MSRSATSSAPSFFNAAETPAAVRRRATTRADHAERHRHGERRAEEPFTVKSRYLNDGTDLAREHAAERAQCRRRRRTRATCSAELERGPTYARCIFPHRANRGGSARTSASTGAGRSARSASNGPPRNQRASGRTRSSAARRRASRASIRDGGGAAHVSGAPSRASRAVIRPMRRAGRRADRARAPRRASPRARRSARSAASPRRRSSSTTRARCTSSGSRRSRRGAGSRGSSEAVERHDRRRVEEALPAPRGGVRALPLRNAQLGASRSASNSRVREARAAVVRTPRAEDREHPRARRGRPRSTSSSTPRSRARAARRGRSSTRGSRGARLDAELAPPAVRDHLGDRLGCSPDVERDLDRRGARPFGPYPPPRAARARFRDVVRERSAVRELRRRIVRRVAGHEAPLRESRRRDAFDERAAVDAQCVKRARTRTSSSGGRVTLKPVERGAELRAGRESPRARAGVRARAAAGSSPSTPRAGGSRVGIVFRMLDREHARPQRRRASQ